MRRRYLCLMLLALTACSSQNEEFEDAWMGNCYLDDIPYAPLGWPIPGAPGQAVDKEDGSLRY